MSDSYALIRKSTLAWLLEGVRDNARDVPLEVAKDLGTAVLDTDAPDASEDRLAMAGPVLSESDHVQLLASDPDLGLPSDGPSAQFWKLVAKVAHTMLCNEAEAVLRLMGERQ